MLSLLFLLTTVYAVRAQINLHSYLEIGKNNTLNEVYIKNAYRGGYQFREFDLEAGIQFDIQSNNPNTLTGIDIIGSGKFSIKDFPFDVKAFFILNRFSDLLYETNLGLRIETKKLEHFVFGVGTNFKTYSINSGARETYNIDKANSKIHENLGLLYLITAYLKPHHNVWNIGLSCTNIDFFLINQPSNPVFNLQMKYKPKSNLSLHFDSWYKQAGMLNIYANYFGYFFRGGIICKI